MSRRKKILLGALVIVLLIPAATLYFVATTESGLQFVVNRLQGRRIGPATITAQGATGTLVDGFKLQRLRIEQRRADVDLAGIEARLALAPLFVPRISLPFVRIKSASIVVKEITATGGKPWQPRFLASALRADIESITIAKGSLTAINGTRYDFTALVGAGVVRLAGLTYRSERSCAGGHPVRS
jgi:autotransporter translocation and assembly factor TamB